MSLPQPDYLGPRCPHCAMPVWRGATRCPHCTGTIDFSANDTVGALGALVAVGLIIYLFFAAIYKVFFG